VTQPTFSPVTRSGEVRLTVATATPEIGRAKKAGLLRHVPSIAGAGTQAPGEGFAMTLAERECAELHVEGVDHHDLVVGIGLVAAKRASLAGRGPTVYDVRAALDHFGVRSPDSGDGAVFAGLAHSYVAQRRFVDSVTEEQLFPRP
jgi:hypothetical protein